MPVCAPAALSDAASGGAAPQRPRTDAAVDADAALGAAGQGGSVFDFVPGKKDLRRLPSGRTNELGDAGRAAAGAVLARLVAANAPALHELRLTGTELGEEGLAPILAALPSNTHLRSMYIYIYGVSLAFAQGTIVPAVHGNTSLRTLDMSHPRRPSFECIGEAERMVNARNSG